MRSCWLILCIVMAAVPLAGAQPARRSLRDGHWWASAPEAVRTSFLDGLIDCSAWGMKTPTIYSDRVEQYSRRVTAWYGAHPAAAGTAVREVLFQFRDEKLHPHSRTWSTVDSGTLWTNPHWFYKGDYWMETYGAGGVAAQEGFVAGYLACLGGGTPLLPARFSLSPAEYVEGISRWYRFDGKTGAMDRQRAHTPIADVLEKLRDGKG